MVQYLLIAEFADKSIGFIIGTYNNENEAESLVDSITDEFDVYSLNSVLEIPPHYFTKYQSYKITGDEYLMGCGKSDKYVFHSCKTNGDLSISVIMCKGKFDVEEFIEYRNLIVDTQEDNLYFQTGSGTISCKDCGSKQYINSFLHGLDGGLGTIICFQCQQCGKFHELKNILEVPEGKKCECGGELSGNRPLFCPECKSKRMLYNEDLATKEA